MDRVEKHKQILTDILQREVKKTPQNMPEVYHQLVIDEARNQFILVAMGWHENEFIHDWIFHIEMKAEQIWIYEDSTDPGIKIALLEQGVRESAIVLAYISEYERVESLVVSS